MAKTRFSAAALLLPLLACATAMQVSPPPDLPKPWLVDPSLECEQLRNPTNVSRVSPEYPIESGPPHIAGEVLVEVIITKEGEVREPRVVRASNPRFIDPVLSALNQWKYEPATCDGVPVEMVFYVWVDFQVAGQSPARGPVRTW